MFPTILIYAACVMPVVYGIFLVRFLQREEPLKARARRASIFGRTRAFDWAFGPVFPAQTRAAEVAHLKSTAIRELIISRMTEKATPKTASTHINNPVLVPFSLPVDKTTTIAKRVKIAASKPRTKSKVTKKGASKKTTENKTAKNKTPVKNSSKAV